MNLVGYSLPFDVNNWLNHNLLVSGTAKFGQKYCWIKFTPRYILMSTISKNNVNY